MSRRSTVRRGIQSAVAALVVAAVTISTGAPSYALPPPPDNPSNSSLNSASSKKAAVAAEVQALSAKLAKAQAQLAAMQAQLEQAQELYNKAVVDLQLATDQAQKSKAAVQTAAKKVSSAQAAVKEFSRTSYMQGGNLQNSAALLDASGPTDLLDKASFMESLGKKNATILGTLQQAQVAKANADSSARLAVQKMTLAEANAKSAKIAAQNAVAQSQAAMQSVQATKAQTEKKLAAAQMKLASLQGQRAQYNAWLIKKKADDARKAKEAAAAAAAAAARAAKAAAAAAAAAANQPAYSAPAPAPSYSGGYGGTWTAAKGQQAANMAQRWLGTTYAWGGGTTAGPSRGVSDGGVADAYGDYNKIGFDCSGLALYAWAQVGISLPHYSGYQYTSGSVHPGVGQLMPGDLLFWGLRGIHHVAIYIGGGMVVQAPQSGDIVRISPIWYSDYVGATRPGT